jgi:hypothetical protein
MSSESSTATDVRAGRYLDNLDVSLDGDLERQFGWRGAHAHISLLANGGGQPNAIAETLQGYDNIEVSRRRAPVRGLGRAGSGRRPRLGPGRPLRRQQRVLRHRGLGPPDRPAVRHRLGAGRHRSERSVDLPVDLAGGSL